MTARVRHRALAGLLLLVLPGSCLVPAAAPPDHAVAATGAAPAAAKALPAQAKVAERLTQPFVLPRAAQQGLAMVGSAPAGAVRVTLDGADVPLAPGGRFLLAFDRDAPPAALLRAEFSDALPVEQSLSIAPGKWRIEQVNAPFRGAAGNDADFARRRPAELDQINAARRMAVDSNGWQQAFIWPVRGRISGLFGAQRVYQGQPGSYHSGLDIAVPSGTPFVAPADGVVTLAAATPFTLEGYLLIVDHGMGLTSAFLHAARLDVTKGQAVRQGQSLGAVGATGRASGPHLHWGMRWRSARLDPLLLLPPAKQ